MFGSTHTVQTVAVRASRTAAAMRDDQLAHDLKNLMTVIVSATEALAESEGSDDEDRRALAQASCEAARLSAGLLRRLLAERQAPEPAATSGDAAEALAQAAQLSAGLLPQGVTLTVQPLGRPLRFRADRDALASALLNLCKNAGEACEAGGEVLLSAAPVGPAEAAKAGLARRGHVRFEVRDTGAGMTPEVLAQATLPYFTTRIGRGGAGLGLHAVAEFANDAGGALRLRSGPGRGTTASLFVPRARTSSGEG